MVLVLLTSVLVPGRTVGRTEPDPRIMKNVLDQAERDAGRGRFESAIEGYRHAHEMSGDPLHHYNVSVIYFKGMNDPLAAFGFAVQFSEEAKTEADFEDSIAWLDEVEKRLAQSHGKIVIEVEPSTAEVLLDGKKGAGREGRQAFWLRPGEHLLLVESEGFEPLEERVVVEEGRTRKVSIDLNPREPTIPIEMKPLPSVPLDINIAEPMRRDPYRPWAWSAIAGGSSFVVAGTVLYVLARRELDFETDDVSTDEYNRRVSRGKAMGYSSYAFWGFGAAALTAGLVLYFAGPGDGKATVHPAGGDGPGIAATFRF